MTQARHTRQQQTEMHGGKLVAYAGLVIPIFLVISNVQSNRGPLSSIDWLAWIFLSIWFLFGVAVAYSDISALLAARRGESIASHIEPEPHVHRTSSHDVLSSLLEEPTSYPTMIRHVSVEDPPAAVVEETELGEEPVAESDPQEALLPEAIEEEEDPVETGPAFIISGAGISAIPNATSTKATDPSLPWPFYWNDLMMQQIAKTLAGKEVVPLLLAITRWKADASPVIDNAIAPLIHRLYPGSALALLVAGTTDTGKSVLLNIALMSGAYFASPERFQFFIAELDSNGVNFQSISRLPHCKRLATTADDVVEMYEDIEAEHSRRSKLFIEASRISGTQIDDLGAYNQWARQHQEPTFPIWYLAVDELRSFMRVFDKTDKRTRKRGPELIEHTAYAMRKTGIGPIYATQYPLREVLSRIAKTQMSTVACFRLEDDIQRRVIFGDDKHIPYYPQHLPAIDPDPANKRYAGRAILKIGGHYYIGQVPTFEKGQREQIIEDLTRKYSM